MQNLPIYISIVFGFTTLLTVLFFYFASNKSLTSLVVICIWLIIQTIISLSGFYTVADTIPPRFLLLVAPPLLLIIGFFLIPKGRNFIDKLNLKTLTILHIVRIPVEIVLFWLSIDKVVPGLMTFEGRNFDILSGLSAPAIYYFGFVKKSILKNTILLINHRNHRRILQLGYINMNHGNKRKKYARWLKNEGISF